MIRIDKVSAGGFVRNVPMCDLEPQFYARIQAQKRSPLRGIAIALIKSAYDATSLSPRQTDLLHYLYINYREIILGTPDILENHLKQLELAGLNHEIRGKANRHFRDWLLNVFGYEQRFRKIKSRGIWYAKQLGVKTCPYCNGHYTIVAKSGDRNIIAKFQFDHFFPAARFPYLSVSMYNLIPSCAPCNIRKSVGATSLATHYHPYHGSLSEIAKFGVEYEWDLGILSENSASKVRPEDLTIKLISRNSAFENFVGEHAKSFDIDGIYENHKDVAYEIFLKAKLYSGAGLKFLSSISGLFANRDEALRYLIGNYLKEEEILERPLAKMTQDIAKDLGLI